MVSDDCNLGTLTQL